MSPARLAALAIALLVLAGLSLQFIGIASPTQPLAKLWVLARYFTILTNLLVGVSLAFVALGRPPGDGWLAGVLLSIGMVGIVYHLLLVPEVPFTGANFWADLALHTLVPLAAALWWLVWGGKRLRPGHLPLWLAWPVLYCLYALVRGQADGLYPYFFLDLGLYGPLRVALNIVGLIAAFALAGLVVLGLARLLARPARS